MAVPTDALTELARGRQRPDTPVQAHDGTR